MRQPVELTDQEKQAVLAEVTNPSENMLCKMYGPYCLSCPYKTVLGSTGCGASTLSDIEMRSRAHDLVRACGLETPNMNNEPQKTLTSHQLRQLIIDRLESDTMLGLSGKLDPRDIDHLAGGLATVLAGTTIGEM